MIAGRRPSKVFLFLLCLWILPGPGRAEAADEAWRKQIVKLETRLFEPIVAVDEVERLLGELKQTDTRAKAAKRLSEQGQGQVERVVAFARDCPDREARQACADVVEVLDSSYRTSELGKQLGAIYSEHTETLLPAYWARFRKDPLDLRGVAMLVHGDPETTYAWLGKSTDRHDRVRYLLLRIRELSPDGFAAEHVAEHTAAGVLLAMPDVFPSGAHRDGPRIYGRVHRAVGHTYLHVLQLCAAQEFGVLPNSDPSGKPVRPEDLLPKIQHIELAGRWVNLFRAGFLVYHWSAGSWMYASQSVRGHSARLGYPGPDEGLCPLPQLTLPSGHSMPLFQPMWWIRPYVPAAYHAAMHFTQQKPGERPPEAIPARLAGSGAFPGKGPSRPASPLDPSAPSVVILPQRLSETADSSAVAAAELLCDRLAEEIASGGIARVVDRSQLDRVLQEKRLSGDLAKPVVGFDAMVRLEVDIPSLVPEARLSLVDLSHGNVMKEERYGWPVQGDDLTRMVVQCCTALKQVGRPAKGKLKVRCLGVENEERNPRIAPLVRRLGEVFEEAVARSPQLTSVRHLEAASAKEESLLMLMGLSRLPGGRRFVPQADATIEIRLREGDGRGKTFEETPIEITVRVARGSAVGDRSLVTGGTVAQFDRAAVQAWERVAALLREARPDAAADWLDAMAVRRRQAEAELRAARAIVAEEPGTSDEQKLSARLAHCEAAMKMDPTLEEAAYETARCLSSLCFSALAQSRTGSAADRAERVLAQALQYFDRFGAQGKHRHEVHESCRIAVHAALGSLAYSGSLDLTSQRLRMTRMAKLILEDAVRHNSHSLGCDYQAVTLTVVCRAMKRTGIPPADRWQWVDGVLEQCAKGEAELASSSDSWMKSGFRREYNELWLRAAELALDDGCADRAKKRIAELQARVAATDEPPWGDSVRGLRGLVARTDDAAALAEFDRWAQGLREGTAELLNVRWPDLELFPRYEMVGKDMRRDITPPVKGTAIRYRPLPKGHLTTGISALAEGDSRLYVVLASGTMRWGEFEGMCSLTSAQVLGQIPLDGPGRPVGKTYRVRQPIGNDLWDSITLVPAPPISERLRILDAKYLDGKLCLGTRDAGLLVFDPKAETWSVYGMDRGLPDKGVYTIFPVDKQTLFCVGRSEYRNGVCYTVRLPEGTVRLCHRTGQKWFEAAPRFLWWDGRRLMGWGDGPTEDLLGPEFKFTPQKRCLPYGWPSGEYMSVLSVAECGGRRFAMTDTVLHELDSRGKILRSWWGPTSVEGAEIPANCPLVPYSRLVAMGRLLVFVEREALVAWDPESDTWHGPLRPECADRTQGGRWTCEHALGTRSGLWLAGSDGMLFVGAGEFLEAAKAAGRVTTGPEYRRRQEERLAGLPPLERAKYAFATRRFDLAEPLLSQVLRENPESAEALLLMGRLCDLACTNRPDDALGYYRRLAALKDNRRASFSGVYLQLVLLRNQKRWPEARATIEEISRRFPKLHDYHQRDVDWWRNHIRTQLAEKDAKRPAAPTSNKEEAKKEP